MAVEHDTIIVGAGSAGCILANRLSADPARRVLLVEAGGEPDPRLTPIRGATFQLQGTRQDWGYVTAAQKHLNGRCIGYARGKCIGGSAAINASLYVRGNAGDYDAWAAAGNKGWSYAEVLPYFRKAECHAEIRNGYHGAEGPLPIERDVFRHPITEVFLAAAQETGCTFNPDYNGETQEGCCYYESNTRSGTRVSTADAYLSPALGRPNLDVLSNAQKSSLRQAPASSWPQEP